MNYKIIIMLFIILFTVQSHAQEIQEKNKINISPNLSSNSEQQILFLNVYSNRFYDFDRYTYPGIFIHSELTFKTFRFNYFDICLNEGFKLGLKQQHKYDLGVVGEYLGLTKNAAAVIIAILSVI